MTVPGEYTFALVASDGELSSVDQVTVTIKTTPEVSLVSPQDGQAFNIANQSITLQADATDQDNNISLVNFYQNGLVIGQGTLVAGVYNLTLASLDLGTYQFFAEVEDQDGFKSQSEVSTISIIDTDPDLPLTVEISNLEDLEIISAPKTLIGTADGETFVNYQLEYREVIVSTLTPWQQFAAGSSSVADGELGIFDPSLLRNGIYDLRLLATNQAGTEFITTPYRVAVDDQLKIGQFTLAFEDLSYSVSGLPITITRTYDSRVSSEHDFGFSWQLGIKDLRIRESRVLGDNWEQQQVGSGFSQKFCITPTNKKPVYVIFPDGRTESFLPTIKALGSQDNCARFANIQEGDLEFEATNGSQGQLEIINKKFIWNGSGASNGQLIDFDFNLINPSQYIYTENNGTEYFVDEVEGLLTVTDRNDNVLSIDEAGFHHSNGDEVLFTRDTENRITEVTDVSGEKLLYNYDTAGRLSTFTNRVGDVTTFYYENPNFPLYLTRIVDPRGIDAIRSEYDADGRLVKQTDAEGNVIEFTHDLSNNTEIVRDRLGRVTLQEYDDFGNIIKTTDPLGGISEITYDDRDNELTTSTPLGFVSNMTYDTSDNVLTEVDPLGNTTTYSYNDFSQPLSITDANNHITNFNYDSKGNLLNMEDAVGAVTGFTYDAKGDLNTLTDAEGNVTTYTRDGAGRELTMIVTDVGNNILSDESYTYDTNGNKTSMSSKRSNQDGSVETLLTIMEYDTENRIVKTILPDNTETTTVYNSIGKVESTTDQLGRVTSFEYDARGNQVNTIYPDLSEEKVVYDAENNQLAVIDKLGRATYFVYDDLNRLATTILPDATTPSNLVTKAEILASSDLADNPRANTGYDADSRAVTSTDENSNTTVTTYDDASRRTLISNALSEVTTFSYDNAGNQLSVLDARNNLRTFEYDDANRLLRTIFPDGTESSQSYDLLGRRVSSTDQEGNITSMSYDGLGRLLTVVDAENFLTEYLYNEQGNLLVQRDALLRETKYEYDQLGRRIKRILPEGEEEVLNYADNGNLLTRTDFNGYTTTNSYDLLDRVLTMSADVTHPSLSLDHAASVLEYSYDLMGNRISALVKNNSSAVISDESWGYDAQDRVVTHAQSNGDLVYGYDPASNLQTVSSANSYNQTYSYDVLNRLSDVNGNSYIYDEVGNLSSVTYVNSIKHEYTYDDLNRLTNLDISDSLNLVNNYAYTLNAVGERTGIQELDGRTVSNTFDNLYRLTSEDIANSLVAGLSSYSYDDVSNRVGRASNVTTNQNFAYSDNDLLTTDTYDDNGNTISSSSNSIVFSDVYDFRDKLIRRSSGSGDLIDLVYDAGGARIQKSVNSNITKYLLDKNNLTGYVQVASELDGADNLLKSYIIGLDLISQETAADTHYYHYDGLGSVRALSDDLETVTDTYQYDAYGELIEQVGVTDNSYLFTGEQYDSDLGMYYFRARYLNAGTGRFHSMDTFEGKRQEPMSLHKYTYGHGNPVGNLDPSGNVTIGSQLSALSVRSGLLLSRVPLVNLFLGSGFGVKILKSGAIPLRQAAKWFKLLGKLRFDQFKNELFKDSKVVNSLKLWSSPNSAKAHFISKALDSKEVHRFAEITNRLAIPEFKISPNEFVRFTQVADILRKALPSKNVAKINVNGSMHTIIRTSRAGLDKGIKIVENAEGKIKTFQGIEGPDLVNFFNRLK